MKCYHRFNITSIDNSQSHGVEPAVHESIRGQFPSRQVHKPCISESYPIGQTNET